MKGNLFANGGGWGWWTAEEEVWEGVRAGEPGIEAAVGS